MACVEKIQCKKCEKKNLQVFYNDIKDTYTGFCFPCADFVASPYEDKEIPKFKVKTKEEIFQEVQLVKEAPLAPAYRGIPAKYGSYYSVRQGVSEADGKTPYARYYPYTRKGKLVGWKVRLLSKKAFWSIGSTKDCDPFGWMQARKAKAKTLYITEGEEDCIAVQYVLKEFDAKTKYKGRAHSVISLSDGVSSIVKTLHMAEEYWSSIVLVMDNDEAGAKAIERATKASSKILIADINVGCKDPCDVVAKGPAAIRTFAESLIFGAKKPMTKGVVRVSSIIDRVAEKPVMGLPYPWEELTDLTYGQRFGECVAWGAGVSIGKCLGKDTPVLMFDESYKMVQDVVAGDSLMGIDHTIRTVKSTTAGLAPMFEVTTSLGATFTCNAPHIHAIWVGSIPDTIGIFDAEGNLHLCGTYSIITTEVYLASDDEFKNNAFLFRASTPNKPIYQADSLIEFDINPIKEDLYFGFDISGDRLFMITDSNIVTHNTLIAHEFSAHNMIENNEKVFLCLLEEQNVDSLRNICGKIDGIPYHKPDHEYDPDQLVNTAEKLSDKLFLWDDSGDQSTRFDMEEIIKAIRYNTLEYGVRFHAIDNMTRIVDGLSASEANEFINKYASVLENLSSQLDIHIDVFSHLNSPSGKISHEEGHEVLPHHFTGSRGIMRAFPVMMGFERNKYAVGSAKSNSYISKIKDRKFGGEGKVKTQYNPETGRLLENEWIGDALYEKPKSKY